LAATPHRRVIDVPAGHALPLFHLLTSFIVKSFLGKPYSMLS
jgi:hypothetical protein